MTTRKPHNGRNINTWWDHTDLFYPMGRILLHTELEELTALMTKEILLEQVSKPAHQSGPTNLVDTKLDSAPQSLVQPLLACVNVGAQ